MRRAITSKMEELKAVNRYNQRIAGCKDEDLKATLTHNRDEKNSMLLEWIAKKDFHFDKELKIIYLLINLSLINKCITRESL